MTKRNEEIKRLDKHLSNALRLVNAVFNTDIATPVPITICGKGYGEVGRYVYRFANMNGADGGVVAVTFRCPGQRDITRVYSVEDEKQYASLNPACAAARMFVHALCEYVAYLDMVGQNCGRRNSHAVR